MTIYEYDFIELEPIKQGDVFRNLPYLTLDLLVKSTPEDEKPTINQSEDIITEIIDKGRDIQVETFISSTMGILASQDCDIREDFDLIFLPLKIIKPSRKNETRSYFKQSVRDPTRYFYLPKIKINEKRDIGPFHAFLKIPFTIPYNIIRKNVKKCWVARINDSAKKVFVGKIAHFYSRTPMEELIFAENNEIINFIEELYKKLKKDKKKLIEKIEEIKKALLLCGRGNDICNIPFEEFLEFDKKS